MACRVQVFPKSCDGKGWEGSVEQVKVNIHVNKNLVSLPPSTIKLDMNGREDEREVAIFGTIGQSG